MFSWHEAPFSRPFIILLLGVLVFDNVVIALEIMLLLSCFLVIFYGVVHKKVSNVLKRSHLESICILLLIFSISGIRIGVKKNVSNKNFSHHIEKDDYLKVYLEEEPKKNKRFRVIASVESIGQGTDQMIPSEGKILIYFPANYQFTPKIHDKYFIKATLQKVVNNTNPHAFDWKGYLANRGVEYQIFLKDNPILIGHHQPTGLLSLARKARESLANIMSKYITNNDHLGVILAMTLGYKNNLSNELYDSYTDTGAVHTLAVSGLHVGIIATLLGFIFQFIPTEKSNLYKISKIILMIIGIWIYAFLTGAAPAILRASLMFSIMIFNFYWSEGKNMINSLCAAGFIMLLIDPYFIYQAGFQFSFLALFGIIFFYPKIERIIPFIRFKPLRYFWGLIAVSFAAQLMVFPITIYYFHKFPSYFWLSGIVAIPFAFIIVMLGVTILISHFMFPFVSEILASVLQFLVSILNYCIRYIQNLPMSSNDGLWLDFIQLILIYLLLLFIGIFIYHKKKITLQIITLLGVILIGSYSFHSIQANNQLKIMVYDIYGGTVIDIIDGKTAKTFKNIPRQDDSEKFMCDNYRLSQRINDRSFFEINDSWKTDRLSYNNGYLVSRNKIFFIAHKGIRVRPIREIELTILTDSYKGNPYQFLESIRTKEVLIDKSMDFDRFYKWKRIFKNKNKNYINLFNEGAKEIMI